MSYIHRYIELRDKWQVKKLLNGKHVTLFNKNVYINLN